MKKNYLKPTTTYVCVECNTIIATSPAARIGIDNSDQGGTEQLSNKQQGTWGDVWSK